MKNAPKVVIFHTGGCPATAKTIALLEECVAELGIQVELTQHLVTSPEEATELRFLGSPTIHVDGIDIDPSVRDARTFGFM